jgi:hypothetical protein
MDYYRELRLQDVSLSPMMKVYERKIWSKDDKNKHRSYCQSDDFDSTVMKTDDDVDRRGKRLHSP